MNLEKSVSSEIFFDKILQDITNIRENPDCKMQQQLWNDFFEKYRSRVPFVNFSDENSTFALYKLPDNTFILNKPCFYGDEKFNVYSELNLEEAISLTTVQLEDYNSQVKQIENKKKEINKFLQIHLKQNIRLVVKN